MKLEDLPETLTPAAMDGGYLLYVCQEGWADVLVHGPIPWSDTTRPEDVVHLLEYPVRPVGWYHVARREENYERVLWWDGDAWRFGPNAARCSPTYEDELAITPIIINEGEN